MGRNKEESFNFYEFIYIYFYTLLMSNSTKDSGEACSGSDPDLTEGSGGLNASPLLLWKSHMGMLMLPAGHLKCWGGGGNLKEKRGHCDKRALAVTGVAVVCLGLQCLMSDRSRSPPLSQAQPLCLHKRQMILHRVQFCLSSTSAPAAC